MSQCDATYLEDFDGLMSDVGIISQSPRVTQPLTSISWTSNFVLYLSDYFKVILEILDQYYTNIDLVRYM